MECENSKQSDLNSTAESQYIYWENRGRLGSVKAFWKTWIDSTFRPFRFFGSLRPESDVESSISYFVIIALLAAFTYIPLTAIYAIILQLQGLDRADGIVTVSLWAAINSIALIVGEVAFSSVVLVISVSLIFVFLKSMRVPVVELKQINRVLLFSSGPLIIASMFFYLGGFIIVCLIAAIWSYFLICIGLRKITQISFKKIIIAVAIAWSISISLIIKALLVLGNILRD
jgi:hypothetical protein